MSVSLEVNRREVCPRSLRSKFRHEGKVPAVVYEYKIESVLISFDGLTLNKLLREHGADTVITMDIDRQKVNTLVHKVRTNTFTNRFEHAEFPSVNMSEETEVETEVVLVGESIGVKPGEVLAQNLYTVVVSATPDKSPGQIEVDVTNLELGDSITAANPPRSDNYKFMTNNEGQVATLVAQSEGEESTGEGGEPEVIGSKEE